MTHSMNTGSPIIPDNKVFIIENKGWGQKRLHWSTGKLEAITKFSHNGAKVSWWKLFQGNKVSKRDVDHEYTTPSSEAERLSLFGHLSWQCTWPIQQLL